MRFLQGNTTSDHLHSGICGIRPEKNVSTRDGENTVWLREDVLPQGKFALSIVQVVIMLLYTSQK